MPAESKLLQGTDADPSSVSSREMAEQQQQQNLATVTGEAEKQKQQDEEDEVVIIQSSPGTAFTQATTNKGKLICFCI